MTRRLHALRVGNFKAFADTQRIPLKPITLIFGPNSAGKSSFIHSLALAHEAQFGRDKQGRARLDVHHTDVGGSAIDLGGFRQYVHRGQANKRVEWGALLNVSTLKDDSRFRQLAQLLSPVKVVSLNMELGIELDKYDKPVPGAAPRVESVEVLADDSELLRMSRRDRTGASLRLDRLASDHPMFQQVLKAIIETQTTSEEVHSEDLDAANAAIADLLPNLAVRIEQFFPASVDLPRKDGAELSPTHMLFPVSKGNRSEDIMQAVRLVLPRTLNDLIKGLGDVLAEELKQLHYFGPLRTLPPRHLAFAEHEDADWYAGGGYAWDVVRRDDAVRQAVNRWLGSDKLKTRYRLEVRSLLDTQSLLDPIARALTRQESAEPIQLEVLTELLEQSSDAAIQAALRKADLGKQRSEWIKRVIDQWRPRIERAANNRQRQALLGDLMAEINDTTLEENFDEFLDQQTQETDAAREAQRIVDVIEQSDGARLRELVLVDVDKDTVVTHRDVGIGISQVLPVLVSAYASTGKLIAMEQPEIHLHPALQAELADVFIDAALGDRKNTFILETHSEHLILRLLRRVREGNLSADDMSVIYVQPAAAGCHVLQIRVDEDGDFVDRWPGGFFEESLQEREAGR